MLAVQKSTESQESMFTGLNVTQNVDLSLISSFPVVPTAPVVLESTGTQKELTPQTNSVATLTQNEESSSSVRPISTTLISAPSFESQIAPSAPVSSVSVTESRKKAVNFSALYAAEVRSFDTPQPPLYPELPTITHRSYEQSHKEEQRSYHYGNDINAVDAGGETEYSSLLSSGAVSSSSYHHQQQAYMVPTTTHHIPSTTSYSIPTATTTQLSSSSSSSSSLREPRDSSSNNHSSSSESSNLLVNELVQENSRLLEELSSLKQVIALAQGENTRAAVAAPPTTSSPATADLSQQAVGTKISDPTVRPKEGVKYVCCGACRQWLMAPRDVVYVVCVGCRAVNNCNLTNPTNTPAQGISRDAETRALQNTNK